MPTRGFGKWLGALAGAIALLALAGNAARADDVLVFGAASLKNAFDAVNTAWQKESGKTAKVSYAGSNALAKQIEEGAPADIFISADTDWMKYLADKDLIDKDSQVQLLGNRIVLIAPKDSAATVDIEKDFDLAGLLGDNRLAMANVDSVPAGKYGKTAVESLGIWDAVSGKVAQADNVRAALKLVSTGEAPFGIVYQTDAASDPDVKIVGVFPEDSHPAIIYPAALTASSKNPDAADLLKFTQGKEARGLFEAQGFTVLVPEPAN